MGTLSVNTAGSDAMSAARILAAQVRATGREGFRQAGKLPGLENTKTTNWTIGVLLER